MKSRPKVSLRDLLWLIIVVVLSVLLWKQSSQNSNFRRQHGEMRLLIERYQFANAHLTRAVQEYEEGRRRESRRSNNLEP